MVKVIVQRSHTLIQSVEICGHADFAPKGQDLVCAAVSSIAIGMMNALNDMTSDTCKLSTKGAHIYIQVQNTIEQNQLLLQALIIQLQTLEETYKSYISITEQEVEV